MLQQYDQVNYGFTFFEGAVRPFRRLHMHNEVEVGTMRGGSVRAIIGGGVIDIRDGDSILFWGSQPHGPLEVSGQPYAHNIVIPLTWVLEWGLPADFQHDLLAGKVFRCSKIDLPFDAHTSFLEWRELMKTNCALKQKLALLELHAFALRIAIKNEAIPMERALVQNTGTNHFQRIASYIAENHREEITVQDIVAQTKLHPKYIMRLFKEQTGCTMLEYLTQQRISTAKHLLISSEMSTADIAFASGFGSVSRFYGAFKSTQGCPPAEFRKTHGGSKWAKRDRH